MVGLLPQNDPMSGLLAYDPDAVKKQALLQAGLAMMANSGPSPYKQNLGSIIGKGGMVGMQAFNEGQQRAVQNALTKRQLAKADRDEARADRRLDMEEQRWKAGGGDPAGWIEFQRQAQAAGLEPGSEEYQRAAKVALGLTGRASSAGAKIVEIAGQKYQQYADGTLRPMSTLDEEAGAAGTIKQSEALGSGRGQTQAEREASQGKVIANLERTQSRTERVNRLVDDLIPRANNFTTGMIGANLADYRGTPQYDLAADLKTLQALAGFSELEEMRANSPTGGALGQVSERELALLQSTLANIEQAQSPEQLQRNLAEFKKAVNEAWQRVNRAYEIDYGKREGQQGAEPQQQEDPLGLRY